MKKRKWVYAQHPNVYGVCCDKCKGHNIDWSEYEHMIWCYDCKIDTKGWGGIFEGPIPMKASEMLGIRFDRIYLKSRKLFKAVDTKDGHHFVYRYGGKELKSKYKEKNKCRQ